jgi:hypothetical protein
MHGTARTGLEVVVRVLDRACGGLLPALGLALVLAGCQTVGTGGVVGNVGGSYRGYLWVEGDPAAAELVLTTRGNRIDASLESETGVSGTGEGRLSVTGLSVEIPYETTCAGRLQLEGRISTDGARYEGEFVATDCTGSTTGRFDFRRP